MCVLQFALQAALCRSSFLSFQKLESTKKTHQSTTMRNRQWLVIFRCLVTHRSTSTYYYVQTLRLKCWTVVRRKFVIVDIQQLLSQPCQCVPSLLGIKRIHWKAQDNVPGMTNIDSTGPVNPAMKSPWLGMVMTSFFKILNIRSYASVFQPPVLGWILLDSLSKVQKGQGWIVIIDCWTILVKAQ
jgi:hypothetical protein